MILKYNNLNSKTSLETSKKLKLTIWERNKTISDIYLNKTIKVYNGKEFKTLKITREKLGFKFGEFVLTRKIFERKKKKKAAKKK